MSTTSRDFFEAMYRVDADPWSFATSRYEQERYRTLLGHIPPGRFAQVFEAGCSIGELTAGLASRCGEVFAIDIAQPAVERARLRCQPFPNVTIERATLPAELPEGPFDLVVFSEIGYYFTAVALAELAAGLAQRLAPGGLLLAGHWTGHSKDHVLGGTQVHSIISAELIGSQSMSLAVQEHHGGRPGGVRPAQGFVVDGWIKP